MMAALQQKARWLGLMPFVVLGLWPHQTAAQTVELPAGVRAVWDLEKAWRQTTPTRERICLNGLWRWQPARSQMTPPTENWGFFKVPGPWPGITNWLQKDCQTLYPHPAWRDMRLAEVTEAWYEREITIPATWTGRRIWLNAETVNSLATVFVDNQRVGELHFPGGALEITRACVPGKKHRLSLLVSALPLRGVLLSYSDTAQARQIRGSVDRRGLCGDVFLESTPAGPRLGFVQIAPSVRKNEITFTARIHDLAPDNRYSLHVEIKDRDGRLAATFDSSLFGPQDLREGTYSFTAAWRPARLWDLHTPENQYEAQVMLRELQGRPLDVGFPERFGFREFWIEGRDFYLNGSRIYLSVVPLDNAQIGAAWATYAAAAETFRRLKEWGINFVYTHNYDCLPGSHLSFNEILQAADDVGMLVALTQPHFGHYDWQAPQNEETNGYARHAAYYVEVAGNHPSVVAYSTSHNATGYVEAMNPDMIDGIQDPRLDWAKARMQIPLRVEALLRKLDPTRIVYHHSSGNLGAMHTYNFYANFTPPQELADWFAHWATSGVKPLFLTEFAAPFSWDFTMYRGWYRGSRQYGSAVVPWELCIAEWNAQFFGDKAYEISEAEKAALRWEAERFRSGQLWHRWDYPKSISAREYEEMCPAAALAITDQWRAFRTWGVSAINAWEYGSYWKPRPGVTPQREELPVDWDKLQRPGFSPDYIEERYERRDLTYRREDWIPTAAGLALERNNRPLLAYIGGHTKAFTEKGHNFQPGEIIEKQLIVINNSRETITADCQWTFTPLKRNGQAARVSALFAGHGQATIRTGEQTRLPLRFALPREIKPGTYEIRAQVKFGNGETQEEAFAVHVLPAVPTGERLPQAKIALWDPLGETTQLLTALGLKAQPIGAESNLTGFDLLIIGKKALTTGEPGPDLSRVREGLRVIVFEQTSEALEKRLGFRVVEYGLRQAFRRVPDHLIVANLRDEHLTNWRGEATLLLPRLSYTLSETYRQTTPTVRWCDIEVPRIWRCGNRGNVASVLLEKPACGDFLPIVDGGYSLQYSPLLEYREGRGLVLFCQLDVTGRTEREPCAEQIVRNIFRYLLAWQPRPRRQAIYVGETLGRKHLQRLGIEPAASLGSTRPGESVLIVGPGGGASLAAEKTAVAQFLRAGGKIVAVGLNEQEANSILPQPVRMAVGEHINCPFTAQSGNSLWAGLSPADAHNKAPRQIPLVTAGAQILGDGALAAQGDNVAFIQLPPWQITAAQGTAAGIRVDETEAAEGQRSALISLGSAMQAGTQIGQLIKKAGEEGKKYTFAVLIKALEAPVTLHLEIERAGAPWDRAVRAPDVTIAPGDWTEIHATFTVDKPFPEGWQAYIACGQDGARFRTDCWRLYEGDYVPWKGEKAATLPANMLTNGSFEEGTRGYFAYFAEQYNLRRTFRRHAYLFTRVLANLGVALPTPLLERFAMPLRENANEQRWRHGLYLDEPIAWDDPYRFFCW